MHGMTIMARQTSGKLQIQVIARAASILRALQKQSAGLSLGELAKRVGLPRSTVQRIVSALHKEKLLVPASATRGVRLGPTVLALARSMRPDFVAFARPWIERLSSELRETVDLAILQDDCVLFIHQTIGQQRLRAVSAVGEAFPLHCTANGKAILAEMDKPQMFRLLPRTLPAFTANTLTNRRALLSELEKIRKSGIAFDVGEHTLGICAVGAALHDAAGHHLAISVPVPSVRFYDNRNKIAARLLAIRDELQRRIIETHSLVE
jgi:DNA-binding IclR family transcriptional regulator